MKNARRKHEATALSLLWWTLKLLDFCIACGCSPVKKNLSVVVRTRLPTLYRWWHAPWHCLTRPWSARKNNFPSPIGERWEFLICRWMDELVLQLKLRHQHFYSSRSYLDVKASVHLTSTDTRSGYVNAKSLIWVWLIRIEPFQSMCVRVREREWGCLSLLFWK